MNPAMLPEQIAAPPQIRPEDVVPQVFAPGVYGSRPASLTPEAERAEIARTEGQQTYQAIGMAALPKEALPTGELVRNRNQITSLVYKGLNSDHFARLNGTLEDAIIREETEQMERQIQHKDMERARSELLAASNTDSEDEDEESTSNDKELVGAGRRK